jgi:hypothetical protein
MPEDLRLDRFFRFVNLEKGLILGAVSLVIGWLCSWERWASGVRLASGGWTTAIPCAG